MNTKRFMGNIDSYILVLFFIYGLISQYFFLSVLAGVTILVILKNMWNAYVPPVLFYFMGIHWLQVFCSLLYVDSLGEKLDDMYASNDLEFLYIMTFTQIILMTLLLKSFVNQKKFNRISIVDLKAAAAKLNNKNVIIGYVISSALMPIMINFTWSNSALFQLTIAFGIVKSAFSVLMVFVLLLKKPKSRWLIIGLLVLDFILSFASFFSDFKSLLILLVIAYLTINPYIRKKALVRIAPTVIILVLFFSFWSYVKGDYREFLNQGTSQQKQVVSNSQALGFIFDEITDFNVEGLREGTSIFLKRLQYMERYSEVYSRVPSVIQFQEGKELRETITFLFVPRFLNPSKGIKDASEKTSYYTGQRFANAYQGTSISMGYFCDLYIDFGLYGMIIPLLLIATLLGVLYQKLLALKFNLLITYSILAGTFLSLGIFESDIMQFLGQIRNNIVFLILGYYTFFPWMNKFILAKK